MGHGHGETYTIPDYRIYKVSDCPKLQVVEKVLAQRGLKDPWLRNEVWRFNEKQWGSESSKWRTCIFRGFKFGFSAFVLTVVGTAIYDKFYPSDHHGHNDH